MPEEAIPPAEEDQLPEVVGEPENEGLVAGTPEIWEFKSAATRDKAVTDLKRMGLRVTVGSTLTVADPGGRRTEVVSTVKKLDPYAARMRHDT